MFKLSPDIPSACGGEIHSINEVLLKFFVIGADNKMMGKKDIKAYQINNVLRVYGEQLRQGRIFNWKRPADSNSPDKISISAKTRRESIADDITSNIIERITQSEFNDNVENTLFKALESEHGKSLNITVSLQKVLDKCGVKIREDFRFQIPFLKCLSNH